MELSCGLKDEAQLRALLLPACESNQMTVTSLGSEMLEPGERVRVIPELKAPTRNDENVEKVVARLSLEIAVNAASWRAEAPVAIE